MLLWKRGGCWQINIETCPIAASHRKATVEQQTYLGNSIGDRLQGEACFNCKE